MAQLGCGTLFLALGFFLAMLQFPNSVNSPTTSQIYPTATPVLMRIVVKAAKPIACGARIQEYDVTLGMVLYQSDSEDNIYSHVEEVIGHYARVKLFSGQPIWTNLVADRPSQVKC